MRIVLDSNVLLAGVATHGLCEALLDDCLGSPEVAVVLSEYILREVEGHLQSKFKLPLEEVRLVVEMLRIQTELVEPASVAADACRDGDDLPILGTLLAAAAECLVTGDKGLLDLGSFEGKPILSPRQFYQRFHDSLSG